MRSFEPLSDGYGNQREQNKILINDLFHSNESAFDNDTVRIFEDSLIYIGTMLEKSLNAIRGWRWHCLRGMGLLAV
jgi:hypothetical protein